MCTSRRLGVLVEELGVVLLQGGPAAGNIAVWADLLAVLRPEGGHRLGIARVEGADEGFTKAVPSWAERRTGEELTAARWLLPHWP